DSPHHQHRTFLVYPEKNIAGEVTHIYLLGSEKLKRSGLPEAQKLINRFKSRGVSFEQLLSPIFLANQPIVKGDFIDEVKFFLNRLENWFHLSKIELSVMVDERLGLDFKKIEQGPIECHWGDSLMTEKRADKKIPYRFLTI